MVGPRFENTIMESQPAPYAAIELIHRQPVRFSEKRVVVCDGGLCPPLAPHPPLDIGCNWELMGKARWWTDGSSENFYKCG